MRYTTIVFLILPIWIWAEKPLVVSSASIFNNMVSEIGGSLLRYESIVPIGADPHTYEPKPSDLALLQEADLILVNGLTFESWIYDMIKNANTSAKVVVITEGIDPIASTNYHGAPDPHAWMSATNGLLYIKNIHKALIKLDPQHKDEYDHNYLAYKAQIEELDAYITSKIKLIPEPYRILITSHDAFSYYGERYGLQVKALMGISTEAEANISDMKRIQESIRSTGIPAIFVESTINPKMINQIAKDNDIVVGGELFADSIGDPQSEAGSYIGMLKSNTDTIVQALTLVVNRINDDGNMPLSTLLSYLAIAGSMLALLGYMVMIMNKPSMQ